MTMHEDIGLHDILRRHAETALVQLRGDDALQQYTVTRHEINDAGSTATVAIRNAAGREDSATFDVLGAEPWGEALQEKVERAVRDILAALDRPSSA